MPDPAPVPAPVPTLAERLEDALRRRFGVNKDRASDEGYDEVQIAEILTCVLAALISEASFTALLLTDAVLSRVWMAALEHGSMANGDFTPEGYAAMRAVLLAALTPEPVRPTPVLTLREDNANHTTGAHVEIEHLRAENARLEELANDRGNEVIRLRALLLCELESDPKDRR